MLSNAEEKLAKIKAKNAEAQRRRRLRRKQFNEDNLTKFGTKVTSTSKRRQQNADAQRRRRQKLLEDRQETLTIVKGVPTDSSNDILPRDITCLGQLCLLTLRRASVLPWSIAIKARFCSREESGVVTMDDLTELCNMFQEYTIDEDTGGMLLNEAFRRLYVGIFGPGRTYKENHGHNQIIADYMQHEQARLGMSSETRHTCDWSTLPLQLQPTPIQVGFPNHPSVFDLFPFPTLRSKLVSLHHQQKFDWIEFCADLNQHPRLTGKRPSFIIRGEDPSNSNLWEVSHWFFLKYPYLFDQQSLEGTNFWRSLRNEAVLSVPLQGNLLPCSAGQISSILGLVSSNRQT